jgi:hypothetical protein
MRTLHQGSGNASCAHGHRHHGPCDPHRLLDRDGRLRPLYGARPEVRDRLSARRPQPAVVGSAAIHRRDRDQHRDLPQRAGHCVRNGRGARQPAVSPATPWLSGRQNNRRLRPAAALLQGQDVHGVRRPEPTQRSARSQHGERTVPDHAHPRRRPAPLPGGSRDADHVRLLARYGSGFRRSAASKRSCGPTRSSLSST